MLLAFLLSHADEEGACWVLSPAAHPPGTFAHVLTFSELSFFALNLGVTRVVLMQGGSLAIFVVAP